MPFAPKFTITSNLANALMRLEGARQAVEHLPITAGLLVALRESARLNSTHYSTMIEGNRLTQEQVSRVIEKQEHFPGSERDEKEVLGYFAALETTEEIAAAGNPVALRQIQLLHALVMSGGKTKVNPSPFRDGQNVIRDSRTRAIVYLPPRSKGCAWSDERPCDVDQNFGAAGIAVPYPRGNRALPVCHHSPLL